MFCGSLVALVTPMTENGLIDEPKFNDLIKWHIDSGTKGLVINGTTGEAPTLTSLERAKNLENALSVANGRIPIIAGTGTNATSSTIAETKQAESLGVAACLVVTPYYNRPTQNGLQAHFKKLAESVNVPLILYNVPTRTGCDLSNDSIVELSRYSAFVGVKEASGNVERVLDLRQRCRKGFALLSGDDATFVDFMQLGGDGVISVTANVLPKDISALCQAIASKNESVIKALNEKLGVLHRVLMCQTNPIPIKWAMWQIGLIDQGIRLPLTVLASEYQQDISAALEYCGISATQAA